MIQMIQVRSLGTLWDEKICKQNFRIILGDYQSDYDGSGDYYTDAENEAFGSGDSDDEEIEYLTEVANDLDPCTTYHFKIVDINQLGEDTIKAAETSAKTDCKEIPPTTTTEIPAQIIGTILQ